MIYDVIFYFTEFVKKLGFLFLLFSLIIYKSDDISSFFFSEKSSRLGSIMISAMVGYAIIKSIELFVEDLSNRSHCENILNNFIIKLYFNKKYGIKDKIKINIKSFNREEHHTIILFEYDGKEYKIMKEKLKNTFLKEKNIHPNINIIYQDLYNFIINKESANIVEKYM